MPPLFLLCSGAAMGVIAQQSMDQISLVKSPKDATHFSGIPAVDLSDPVSASTAIVKACEDLGFFKITNHGIPTELILKLEEETLSFFSLPQSAKDLAGPAKPFGYGSKCIGPNGDLGWLEYLLFDVSALLFLNEPFSSSFRSALKEYIEAMQKLAGDVLELMADGLGVEPKDVFKRVVMHEKSDSVFRLNHYPPCQCSLLGFGEHTDPQVISILRSNNSAGLQVALRDGTWVPVPPDPESFFVNVGDILQVLTNGRFRSVRHRVVASGGRSRLSMIYFGGPAAEQRLSPAREVIEEGEQSLYREFTWAEYKSSVYKSRLGCNRLGHFESHAV